MITMDMDDVLVAAAVIAIISHQSPRKWQFLCLSMSTGENNIGVQCTALYR